MLDRVHNPEHEVTIALVGKYVDLPDAYLSVTEALRAGGFAHRTRVNIRWVASDNCTTPEGAQRELDGVHGVLIPGGFGVRGIEGKVGAIRHARENGIPLLGICLGLQCMVIEYARDVAGLRGANSLEFDDKAEHPVVSTMADQTDVVAGERDMGGTMQLGLPGPAPREHARPGTVRRAEEVRRHRHRYEVSNAYRPVLEEAGLVSGVSPDGSLVEYVELPGPAPFFLGMSPPGLRSRPPAPTAVRGFIEAALKYSAGTGIADG